MQTLFYGLILSLLWNSAATSGEISFGRTVSYAYKGPLATLEQEWPAGTAEERATLLAEKLAAIRFIQTHSERKFLNTQEVAAGAAFALTHIFKLEQKGARAEETEAVRAEILRTLSRSELEPHASSGIVEAIASRASESERNADLHLVKIHAQSSPQLQFKVAIAFAETDLALQTIPSLRASEDPEVIVGLSSLLVTLQAKGASRQSMETIIEKINNLPIEVLYTVAAAQTEDFLTRAANNAEAAQVPPLRGLAALIMKLRTYQGKSAYARADRDPIEITFSDIIPHDPCELGLFTPATDYKLKFGVRLKERIAKAEMVVLGETQTFDATDSKNAKGVYAQHLADLGRLETFVKGRFKNRSAEDLDFCIEAFETGYTSDTFLGRECTDLAELVVMGRSSFKDVHVPRARLAVTVAPRAKPSALDGFKIPKLGVAAAQDCERVSDHTESVRPTESTTSGSNTPPSAQSTHATPAQQPRQ